MMKVSKRDKKVLIFGGVFTAVVIAVVYVILPFLEAQSEMEANLRQAEMRLEQSMRVIQSEGFYRNQQVELEEVLRRFRAQLLDAEDADRARVQLQAIVRELAEESGVTISRSTPMQERQVGENYTEVTLQINLQAEMQELTNFLYAISTHPKFLKVEQFQINMHRSRSSNSMQPRMNVSAYIRLSKA